MNLFKRKHESKNDVFFEEDSLDARFDEMMSWIKWLSRKDFNKVKKAMDNDYEAYQALHGIEPNEEISNDEGLFMLPTEEDK